MSEKSYHKSAPRLTNITKKYQIGKPTSDVYTSAWDCSELFSILSL